MSWLPWLPFAVGYGMEMQRQAAQRPLFSACENCSEWVGSTTQWVGVGLALGIILLAFIVVGVLLYQFFKE